MGSIADIKIPKVDVNFSGGSFPVRGLNLDDLDTLISDSGGELEKLFDIIAGRTEHKDAEAVKEALEGNLSGVAIKVARQLPNLLARAVCLAADDYSEETIAKVRKFPISIQYEALMASLALSFDIEGDPKKALGVLMEMVMGYNDSLKDQVAEMAQAVNTP